MGASLSGTLSAALRRAFAAFVEVETDPKGDGQQRERLRLETLGSQNKPLWFLIDRPEKSRPPVPDAASCSLQSRKKESTPPRFFGLEELRIMECSFLIWE